MFESIALWSKQIKILRLKYFRANIIELNKELDFLIENYPPIWQ